MKFCHEKEQYFQRVLNNEIGNTAIQEYSSTSTWIHFSELKKILNFESGLQVEKIKSES